MNAVNIATPPKLGMMRLWIFLDSAGASKSRFLTAKVMIGGIANTTSNRLVRKIIVRSIISFFMCPIVVNNNRAKNATKIEKKSKLTNIPLVIHSWLTANQKSIGFLLKQVA